VSEGVFKFDPCALVCMGSNGSRSLSRDLELPKHGSQFIMGESQEDEREGEDELGSILVYKTKISEHYSEKKD